MQTSQNLVNVIRASFVLQGTTLKKFCRENGIDDSNIYNYLRGDINSAKAIAARELVIKSAMSGSATDKEKDELLTLIGIEKSHENMA